METFNKILDNGSTKFCHATCDDWDKHVPIVLWSYRTITKKIRKYKPFQLVYGKEAVVIVEFISPSMDISHITHMIYDGIVASTLDDLIELDEYSFLASFH